METLTNPFLQKQLEENKHILIKLEAKVFAEYQIIYHIKNCCSINELSTFSNKLQFQFLKFTGKQQQLNLIYIDSYFVEILADIALDVFFCKVSTLHDFIQLIKQMKCTENEFEMQCMSRKLHSFVSLLAYSDIASEKTSKGEEFTHRIYGLKNASGETDFYSIYDRNKLIKLLFHTMKLNIDISKSYILGDNVNLCLKIYME